jgi:hypothetical protein
MQKDEVAVILDEECDRDAVGDLAVNRPQQAFS